ncbi:MAG: hypothetical protein HOM11_11670 [Methylococcales bacterium]|jgi:serine-type D-Ala-D-Ala carboxypeptidase/endopeptidase (penicillin-binding protein 4)|nr:hypothetical protein [Methylococcales bacterium]MBT7443723.1 hypothetical protein [Methylococcales bacterium]
MSNLAYNLSRQTVDYLLACTLIVLCSLMLSATAMADSWAAQFKKDLAGGAVIIADPTGKILWQHNADKANVPASIIKIATAGSALEHLGNNYQFKTEFYLTKDNRLAIKGFGDPSLISEALEGSIQNIHTKLPKHLTGFIFDTQYFSKKVIIHGQSKSNNPYDASNGALIANFNTIKIHRKHNQKIYTGETQTPLTNTARLLAKPFPTGKHRINVGHDIRLSLQNLSELIQAFLAKKHIRIEARYSQSTIPKNAQLIHTQYSKPLTHIVQGLLRYSNNFTANQLLLVLGAERLGAPASLQKGLSILSDYIAKHVKSPFNIEEGSGLSRKTQISARGMLSLVRAFQPYFTLLKHEPPIWAKTGTLSGLQTYAGFIESPNHELYPFVIMLNKQKPFAFRKALAKRLGKQLGIIP